MSAPDSKQALQKLKPPPGWFDSARLVPIEVPAYASQASVYFCMPQDADVVLDLITVGGFRVQVWIGDIGSTPNRYRLEIDGTEVQP